MPWSRPPAARPDRPQTLTTLNTYTLVSNTLYLIHHSAQWRHTHSHTFLLDADVLDKRCGPVLQLNRVSLQQTPIWTSKHRQMIIEHIFLNVHIFNRNLCYNTNNMCILSHRWCSAVCKQWIHRSEPRPEAPNSPSSHRSSEHTHYTLITPVSHNYFAAKLQQHRLTNYLHWLTANCKITVTQCNELAAKLRLHRVNKPTAKFRPHQQTNLPQNYGHTKELTTKLQPHRPAN